MEERIELRSVSGHLLGVLIERGLIEIKRGRRLYLVDVLGTLGQGAPVILESDTLADWMATPVVEKEDAKRE